MKVITLFMTEWKPEPKSIRLNEAAESANPELVDGCTIVFPDIVLIGPVGAGKSALAPLLAQQLCLPHTSLDQVGERYYQECGIGQAVFKHLTEEQGFLAAYRQWWPALAHATESFLAEHGRGVVDLGAGHSHYEDPVLFERVRRALTCCTNVLLLLLPCADLDRSVRLIRERSVAQRGWDWMADGYDFLAHWVKDPCNHELATLTIYTEGSTPAQTCAEILKRIQPIKPL